MSKRAVPPLTTRPELNVFTPATTLMFRTPTFPEKTQIRGAARANTDEDPVSDAEVYAALKLVATGWDAKGEAFSQGRIENHIPPARARELLAELAAQKGAV